MTGLERGGRPSACDRALFISLAAGLACGATPPEAALPEAAAPVQPIEASPSPAPALEPPEPPQRDWARMCGELEPPGPACESFYSTVGICERLADVLDPTGGAAGLPGGPLRGAAVMQCIADGDRTELMCNFGVVDCLAKLKPPASDPSDGACADIVAGCVSSEELSEERCRAIWTAVRPHHRAAVAACMEEHCGIDVCVWGHAAPRG